MISVLACFGKNGVLEVMDKSVTTFRLFYRNCNINVNAGELQKGSNAVYKTETRDLIGSSWGIITCSILWLHEK